eukprot:TRINITY_DN1752_c0_g2_i1.p1 TRINITY_DN1752_c0_g2~~TRINITY_DN1752_c0_g2_i1.p1  ORF type:complete len:250 (+),score=36.96 TRINITY_DN1752_c0_g2_i1:195-944(+)
MASVRRSLPFSLRLFSPSALAVIILGVGLGATLTQGQNYLSLSEPKMGPERIVFQTKYGDMEFGLYPTVAPVTAAHILKLARLGGYNTNHFFRVDRGFVAQVADVMGGREVQMTSMQREEAEKKLPGEFSNVPHRRGILSMGRSADPNSAMSSFSVLLGDAPHLDRTYAVFGKMTAGEEVLRQLEELPTRREGIFVMPTERITILSTYVYVPGNYFDSGLACEDEVARVKAKLVHTEAALQEVRHKCLP